MNALTRQQVERAIIALADADTAVTLATAAIRAKLTAALGQLGGVRKAFELREHEVRLTLEAQAKSDVKTSQGDDEFKNDEPGDWFASWLEDEGEHAIEPFTADEALAIYTEAFNRVLKEADNA